MAGKTGRIRSGKGRHHAAPGTHGSALVAFGVLAACIVAWSPAVGACSMTTGTVDPGPGLFSLYDLANDTIVQNVTVPVRSLGASCELANPYAHDDQRIAVLQRESRTSLHAEVSLHGPEGASHMMLRSRIIDMGLHGDWLIYLWYDAGAEATDHDAKVVLHHLPTADETIRTVTLAAHDADRVMTGRRVVWMEWDPENRTNLLNVYDALDDKMLYEDRPLTDWGLPSHTMLGGASDQRLYLVGNAERDAWTLDLPPTETKRHDPVEDLHEILGHPRADAGTPMPTRYVGGGPFGIQGDSVYRLAFDNGSWVIEQVRLDTGNVTTIGPPYTPHPHMRVKQDQLVLAQWSIGPVVPAPREPPAPIVNETCDCATEHGAEPQETETRQTVPAPAWTWATLAIAWALGRRRRHRDGL